MKLDFRKILGVAFLLILGITFYVGSKKSSDTEIINRAPDEYLSIFKNSKLSKFQLIHGQRDKNGPALCSFIYDSSYYVFITRMDNIFDRPLTSIIKEKYKSNRFSRSANSWYSNMGSRFLNIDCLTDMSKATDELILTFNASDFKRIILNDTVAYYHFYVANLAIQYDINWPQEFYISGNFDRYPNMLIPLEVLIFKKDSLYYLIFMSTQKGNLTLPSGALLELIEAP